MVAAVGGDVVVAVVVGGDKAAATAATAAGLEAMAASSSGESVVGVVAAGDGVLVAVGSPEWSMGAGSGTGDRGRIPETPGCETGPVAAGVFLVMAISWR